MDTFIPGYLRALGKQLSPYIDPRIMQKQLLAATELMTANNRQDLTLKDVFDQNFYPILNIDYDQLEPTIENFYDQKFPSLKPLTKARPQAIDMVKQAQALGYDLAIATNPLFPIKAIIHRLNWAELPPNEYFSIIPSYNTFHFAKPNPAFFTELLAQLGWPEGPVVMVGDDKEMDILPAQKIGLATFWVTEKEDDEQVYIMDEEPPASSGPLKKLLPWLTSTSAKKLTPRFQSVTAITSILQSTPAATATLLNSIPVSSWKERADPEEWTICEILCHLRDVDLEINIPRIETILKEDNAFIPAINADSWAEVRNYQDQDASVALADFIKARSKLLEKISDFSEVDWNRPVRHTIFGPTNLKELLKFGSRHDRLHMQQIHKNCSIIKLRQ